MCHVDSLSILEHCISFLFSSSGWWATREPSQLIQSSTKSLGTWWVQELHYNHSICVCLEPHTHICLQIIYTWVLFCITFVLWVHACPHHTILTFLILTVFTIWNVSPDVGWCWLAQVHITEGRFLLFTLFIQQIGRALLGLTHLSSSNLRKSTLALDGD